MASAGSGTFAFPDGARYEGEWVESGGKKVREGSGRYDDGVESYVGAWSADMMAGSGVFKAASGAVYEGDFKANRFDGEGTYTWPDGATYKGGWREGKFHGQGVYTDADGVAWTGEFYNGRFFNGKAYLALRSA